MSTRRASKPASKRSARSVASKRRAVRPDDILQYHFIGDPQISPDGETILFAKRHVGKKNEYVSNLWTVPTGRGEPKQFTSGGKDGSGRWSPDGTRVAFISGREKPNPQIFAIDTRGGEAAALTRFPDGSIGEFEWSPDGKMLAVSFREAELEWTEKAKKEREESGHSLPARVIDEAYYRLDGDGYFNGQRHHIYIVDASTGDHRKVFDKATLGWVSFSWSPDSRELAVAANTDKDPYNRPWRDRVYRLNVATGKHSEIPNQPDGSKGSVKWSPDGKRIAYVGVEGREDLWSGKNDCLFVMSATTGRPKNLTGREDFCLGVGTLSDSRDAGYGGTISWSPDSRRIYMRIGWHGEVHVASIDASGGKIKFLTAGSTEHAFANLSSDGRRMALAVCSSTSLSEVAVGAVTASSVATRRLTSFNDKLLGELELSVPKSLWITAADGNRVHVWIMMPPGAKSGRKLPAVLEIHGGPHAQYGWPYFHEFQVLAAAGYVVVFSNPRGSKGYGEQFCDVIRGDWGNKDWVDIRAVADWIFSRSFVDPKRVGVMGGSYGGYMTNWVIGHTDDFAGAITDRCVSNLLSMATNSDFPLMPDRYWPGSPWDRPEKLWSMSPIKYFKNVKTPTLVIHSEGDLRCNVEQGEQVFTSLKVLGVPTRFVRYPSSTSHGMSRSGPPDLRIHRLNQILDWWSTHLGRKAKASRTAGSKRR